MIISFELTTIVYLIVLIPTLVFLCVFTYRVGKSLEIALLERWNRRIVKENKRVIMENIKSSHELINAQRELRKELELSKEDMK